MKIDDLVSTLQKLQAEGRGQEQLYQFDDITSSYVPTALIRKKVVVKSDDGELFDMGGANSPDGEQKNILVIF